MAHTELDTPAITVEVPDNSIGLKRKATLHTMIYNQTNKYLVLSWKIDYFKNVDGDYGDQITEPGIISYSMENIADNRTIVDIATGRILTDADKDQETGEYTVDTIGQYDFFYYLATNIPTKVHEMIVAYGNASIWD